MFSPNPHLVKETTYFLFFTHLYGLNWPIAICPCNKDPDLIFLLNRLVYLLPTAMGSITRTHTVDSFYLLKENFKNLLFDPLIKQRSFEKLSYVSSCSLSQRWKFQRKRLNVLWEIESDLTYKKVSGFVPNTFYSEFFH